MANPSKSHYKIVTNALIDGELIPFLGAGASLFGRPEDSEWQPGAYLPRSDELAKYLGRKFGYASEHDLTRVAQYVALMSGSGDLYKELHSIFATDHAPTLLHQSFATLRSMFRDKGYVDSHPMPLIVTTNYDDLLERAFDAAQEPYDLVTYEAEGLHRGKFWHRKPDGETVLIEQPRQYGELGVDKITLEKRTTILKIHGAINRAEKEKDSYVITEDHYIDYLMRTDPSTLMPVTLEARLRNSHLLFLGYSLRDWNLRVILHRIWGAQRLTYTSWAILRDPQELDKKFWAKRDVDFFDMPLEDYMAELNRHAEALTRKDTAT